MGGVMRYFVIGLLFWFTLILPGSAKSADGIGYKLVGLKQSVKEAMKIDTGWRACGDYFAGGETTEGRIVHFTYEKGSPDNLITVFAFATVDRVMVSIGEKVSAPTAIILGQGKNAMFILQMKMKDYRDILPCLAKSTKV